MSLRAHTIAILLLTLTACSFEESAAPGEHPDGWMLGGEDQAPDQQDQIDLPGPMDMPEGVDMPGSVDMPGGVDMPNPTDMPSPPDMPNPPDMLVGQDMPIGQDMPNPPDMAVDQGTGLDQGTAMTNDPCGRNAECSAGLICCVSLSGGGECQPSGMCLGGQFDGLCQVDAECPGQVCCDLPQQAGGLRACQDSCGGVTLSCMTNSECSNGEVCCPGLGGAECKAQNQCFTGGLCQMNSDCPGQKQCCSFSAQAPSVCLDRCSF
jgi:hypothetical protein